jgi:WD40 repeat protein
MRGFVDCKNPWSLLLSFISGVAWLTGCFGEKDDREIAAEILHGSKVNAVAFSPKGDILASAGEDDTIRLLDVSDLYQAQNTSSVILAMPFELPWSPLIGLGTGFKALAFSTSEQSVLASGNFDFATGGVIQFWDIDSGSRLFELDGHQSPVQALAFDPAGELLASGSGRASEIGETELWDMDTKQPIGLFDQTVGGVHSIAFSPDGTLFAAACGDGKIRVRNVEDGSLVFELSLDEHLPYSVAFSPDGAYLASGGDDSSFGLGGIVRIWDLSDGALAHSFDFGIYAIRTLAYSPDGSVLAVAGDSQIISLARTATFELLDTLKGHAGPINSLAFSPDGKLLASGSDDRYVRVWFVGDLMEPEEPDAGDTEDGGPDDDDTDDDYLDAGNEDAGDNDGGIGK